MNATRNLDTIMDKIPDGFRKVRTYALMTVLAMGSAYSLGSCGNEKAAVGCSKEYCVEECKGRAQTGRDFDRCQEQDWYCGRSCGEETVDTDRGTRRIAIRSKIITGGKK